MTFIPRASRLLFSLGCDRRFGPLPYSQQTGSRRPANGRTKRDGSGLGAPALSARVLIAALILFPVIALGAEDIPDSFQGYVPYALGPSSLFLAPELAEAAEMLEGEDPQNGNTAAVVFPLGSDSVSISFDPGPSEDPTFVIEHAGRLDELGGEQLFVSSTGNVYLVRRSNELFEKRLKYRISDGRLEEVPQPFYLAAQDCEASATVRIYDRKCNQGNLIATLPKGASVRLLLLEGGEEICPESLAPGGEASGPLQSYLVSTPFGLVGWVASSGGHLDQPGSPLGCLRFQGD